MKLYTYGGETATQALKTAQDKHGENALVVKTREVRKKSLTRPGLYEIIVAVEEDINLSEENQDSKNKSQTQSQTKKKSTFENLNTYSVPPQSFELRNEDEDVRMELSDTIQKVQPSRIQSQEHGINPQRDIQLKYENKLSEKQQTQNHEFSVIKNEIEKIHDKIKLIQNMFWEEKAPNIQIPQEFAEIYRIAKNSGMHNVHLDEIMRISLELMPLNLCQNSLMIKRYFREILRKMIYCRNENLDLGNRKIMMLIGPTGVGKTTTIAKLAARYSKLMEKKYRVGIITLDTYRIGALEQLTWYAKKMKISIETVIEPGDFLREIDALRYCDVILVDTAGHSQHDKDKINGLKHFVHNDYKIDVNLVLSATTKFEDLKDIYTSFGELGVDSFIFSKIDESRGLGNLFSLAYESKKPISYLSVGQEVPTDLCIASNDYLADCLLNGFYNPNKVEE